MSGVHYNNLLNQILLPEKYVYTPVTSKERMTFVQIVRKEFRQKIDENVINSRDRVEAGFAIVRKFSSLWKYYLSMGIQPSEQVTHKNDTEHATTIIDDANQGSSPSFNVNLLSSIKPGVILLSHPMVDGPLRRSVILIIQHESQGTYGLVLNRPTDYDLKHSVKGLSRQILKAFSKQRVSFGGMVKRLQFIHTFENCGGVEIPYCSTDNRKFYSGGDMEKVLEIIETIDAEQLPSYMNENIRFFVGCCAWNTDQLQREYEAGYWIPVIANTDEVLNEVRRRNIANHEILFDPTENDLFNSNVSDSDEDDEEDEVSEGKGNNHAADMKHVEIIKSQSDKDIEFDNDTASVTTEVDTDHLNDFENEMNQETDMDEEEISNEIWQKLISSIQIEGAGAGLEVGNNAVQDLQCLARLPVWADISTIDSVDWP